MSDAPRGRRAVFFDRDGTLIEDEHYLSRPELVRLRPQAAAAVRRVNTAGLAAIVVTNQSGVGRGLLDFATLCAIHDKMHRALAQVGGRIDAIFFCPHTAESRCECRKPKAGMLREIGVRFNVDMTGVACVGDGLRDLQAAQAVGAQPMLVLTGKGEKTLRDGDFPTSTVIFPDLAFVASALLAAE